MTQVARPHDEDGGRSPHPAGTFISGMRTSLRENGSAYGFSVSITAGFGLVSSEHPSSNIAVPVLLFAAAAVATFIVVEALAFRLFQHIGAPDRPSVVVISGAVDGLSVLCAVGAGIGLARIPGLLAWPATASGMVLVFILVGGLDVLIARRMARHAQGDDEPRRQAGSSTP